MLLNYASFLFQHCKIYLCGTKSDLIEGDRSLRQIDYHDAQDFAEGKCSVVNLLSLQFILMVLFPFIFKWYQTERTSKYSHLDKHWKL